MDARDQFAKTLLKSKPKTPSSKQSEADSNADAGQPSTLSNVSNSQASAVHEDQTESKSDEERAKKIALTEFNPALWITLARQLDIRGD